MADDQRPIIIKKIKKGGHGHHGGAWKVAYADFVTAMMAFFLLLWLLSSADEATLEGIAEYFTPTIGIRDSMGIGFEGGTTAAVDGVKKSDAAPPGIIQGQVPQGPLPEDPKEAMIEAEKDAKLFEKAEEDIKKAFESDPALRELSDNIIVEQSPEGLKIEVMDSDKQPMFDPGRATLTRFGQKVLSKMGKIIDQMPNFISVEGHTDASPTTARGDYTNWELSIDRANSARRFLIRNGMDPERPKKVVGKAATELLLKDEPKSPRNRRITLIMLRGSYLQLDPSELPATRELISVPKPKKREAQKLRDKKKAEKKKKLEEQKKKLDTPGNLLPGQPAMPKDMVPQNEAPTEARDVLGVPGQEGAPGAEQPKEPEKVDAPDLPEDRVKPPSDAPEVTEEDLQEFLSE